MELFGADEMSHDDIAFRLRQLLIPADRYRGLLLRSLLRHAEHVFRLLEQRETFDNGTLLQDEDIESLWRCIRDCFFSDQGVLEPFFSKYLLSRSGQTRDRATAHPLFADRSSTLSHAQVMEIVAYPYAIRRGDTGHVVHGHVSDERIDMLAQYAVMYEIHDLILVSLVAMENLPIAVRFAQALESHVDFSRLVLGLWRSPSSASEVESGIKLRSPWDDLCLLACLVYPHLLGERSAIDDMWRRFFDIAETNSVAGKPHPLRVCRFGLELARLGCPDEILIEIDSKFGLGDGRLRFANPLDVVIRDA